MGCCGGARRTPLLQNNQNLFTGSVVYFNKEVYESMIQVKHDLVSKFNSSLQIIAMDKAVEGQYYRYRVLGPSKTTPGMHMLADLRFQNGAASLNGVSDESLLSVIKHRTTNKELAALLESAIKILDA